MLVKSASSWYLAFLRGEAICKAVDCSRLSFSSFCDKFLMKFTARKLCGITFDGDDSQNIGGLYGD